MNVLASLPLLWLVLGGTAVALTLGFVGAPLIAWTAVAAAALVGLGAPPWLWVVFGALAFTFNVPALRTALVTRHVLALFRKKEFLPAISQTEREAIEAGTVWVDGELFSGKPDFAKLLAEPYPELSPKEQAFLDGPVEELCKLANNWEIYQRRDLPPRVWDFLKRERFLGLIIPEEYDGLGFSATAHSAIVAKLGARNMALASTVMVPNALGPAELLIHYGTKAQKEHYLPRLARGEDIPCFALTEPGAGSDAGSLTSSGVVFRGDDGQLYLRLDWNKRYITLAAISTVLGLAFRLRDPKNLLGKGVDVGITCAIIPSDAPGVHHDRRHDPLGVPFYNCPSRGEGVVVPIDAIIGGVEFAGRGWKMLVESLASGRGVSLPASSAGGLKHMARITGAYAAIRKQFGLPIGRFEGIQEPLARIGGFAYMLEAARRYTTGALDSGAKPSVVTAIAKYEFTELCRKAMTDTMDVLGGRGISLGPRNPIGHGYMAMPISITVEGANILTRTLMIFGQGAIRCHPFAYAEIQALEKNDARAFDAAFVGHVGHVVRNASRALLLSLSRGALARSPVDGPAARHYKKLAWSSASFALLADVAMASLGGDLKRKETITGRFADVFAWMYLANATLRRFEAEGRRAQDRSFLDWSLEHALARIQEGFDGIFENLDVPLVGFLLRGPLALWSRANRIGRHPSDQLGAAVARALQVPGEQRDHLTSGMYFPTNPDDPLGELEHALALCHRADAVADKIKHAVRAGVLPRLQPIQLVAPALAQGIISAPEAELVAAAEAARERAIQVDSFTLEEYMASAVVPKDRPAEGGEPRAARAAPERSLSASH